MESLTQSVNSLQEFIGKWLLLHGFAAKWTKLAAIIIAIVALIIICWICYFIIRKLIFRIAKRRIDKSDNKNAAIFIEKKAFVPLANLIPAFLVFFLTPPFFGFSGGIVHLIRILSVVYIIVSIVMAIKRTLKSLEYIALRTEKYEQKPIGSYVQMGILITYIICGILLLSILIGRSPLTIITAFGAGMAIIILVFKDTILGLIASIQLSVNDMVRLGDWIEVPAYNADGDLIEINLMSVKVRNWDKTVTNVPTYALISGGFKNWREMQDLGMRRITHNLLVDINTIRAVDENFVETLNKKGLFKGSTKDLKWEKDADYQQEQVTTVTNLGLFRKYMEDYLNAHPGISDVYVVVYHIQQTGDGLPIGIYAFSKDVSWKPLQQLQADIFEHFYAIIKEFDLQVFQKPSGTDIRILNQKKNPVS